MVKPFEELFPGLAAGDYEVTSPADKRYNCIAYAAGDFSKWWWPTPTDVKEVFWPAGVGRSETIGAFRDAFATLGFSECANDDVEASFEKVALFANDSGTPLHAARQLATGRWTSKLGELQDIGHSVRDLEGDAYGKVVLIMKRPTPIQTSTSAPAG